MAPSSTTLSLGLEDDDDDNKHPRRFLKLPSGHLLAYGGNNGNVTCFHGEEFIVVQRYDDGVRSMDVSSDGKRLAIGFDNGETKIYYFDDYTIEDNDDSNENHHIHPYIEKAVKSKMKNNNDDDDDDKNDPLLSQQGFDDMMDDGDYFIGPEFGTPIRDLKFLPRAATTTTTKDDDGDDEQTYKLAVASESGMSIVDATNFGSLTNSPHLLEKESKEHHDNCGIRGLAIVDDIMASLAMDGRLCLWDLKSMTLLKREESLCVPKKDVGEIHDADPYDRSCRPILYKKNSNNNEAVIVGTPGKIAPCLRVLNKDSDMLLQEVDESCFEQTVDDGHIESIVTILFCSDNLFVTGGRDGRVLFWECQNQDEKDLKNQKWKVVQKHELSSSAPTDLCFHNKQIHVACANGSCQSFDVSDKFFTAKVNNKAKKILHHRPRLSNES